MMTVFYTGDRGEDGESRDVFRVEDGVGVRLDPRPSQKAYNHSPDGFEWGYGGSGPAQLSLALCIDALDGDVERALAIYQDFKFRVVGRMAHGHWELSRDSIRSTVVELEQERDARRAG